MHPLFTLIITGMKGIQPSDPGDSFNEAIDALEDNEIIGRVLKGEKNLYALIIRKYNQRLYRVGLSILNNGDDVQDVMQIAYIKAYEHLHTFQFRSAFATWLTKILVNESLQYLKKKAQPVQKESGDYVVTNRVDIDHQTPLVKVLNAELRAVLESAIRQLPEKYRTVFIMREMENMTVAETEEILGLSRANVKVRLNRAKLMLRDLLRGYLQDEEIMRLYAAHCDRMVDTVMKKIIDTGH